MIKKIFILLLAGWFSAGILFAQANDPLSQGLQSFNVRDFESAATNFDLAIKKEPKNALAWFYRGKLYLMDGDYDNALRCLNKSIEYDIRHTESYQMRGEAHLSLKNYPEAVSDFNTTLALNPKLRDTYISRGLAQMSTKDYKSALADFDQGVKYFPDDDFVRKQRGMARVYVGMVEEGCSDLLEARRLGAAGIDHLLERHCDGLYDKEIVGNEKDLIIYENPDILDSTMAVTIDTFSNDDIESMLTYFYASKIRNDDKWREVLPPEDKWSGVLKYGLIKYKTWQFESFQIIKREKAYRDIWKIEVEMIVKGRPVGESEHVTARQVEGIWEIIELPN